MSKKTFIEDMLFLEELIKLADEKKMSLEDKVDMITNAMADILAERKENMSSELRAKVDAMLERDRERKQRKDN